MSSDTDAKEALGEWLALTPEQRKKHKLPATQGEFAERWAVSPRTVIRWKQRDPLVDLVCDRTMQELRQGSYSPGVRSQPEPDVAVADTEPTLEGETRALTEFETLRQQLVRDAMNGEKGAREEYFKWFGKDIIAEQKAQRDSTFADLSDEELVDRILSMVGRSAVEAWLASK